MPSEALIERYRDAALKLLPPGHAFAKGTSTNLAALIKALMAEFARVHEAADALLADSVPSNTVGLIDVWEDALGLPGPCVSAPSTVLAERQGAVLTKLLAKRSHAASAFTAAALALGYEEVAFERATFAVADGAVADSGQCYDDAWAWSVTAVVLVGDQQADQQLICTFVDELRRAHGFVGVVLEGPMGASRNHVTYYNAANALGASATLSTLPTIEVRYSGYLSIQCTIDNGAGAAPSDAPVGVWELYSSADGTSFTRVGASDSGLAAELAKVAPNGNNLVDAFAVLDALPGRFIKVRYNRTSGGGGNSRVRMLVSSW